MALLRIELPGSRGKKNGGPRVKKSQEGNPGQRIYFETKYKDSLQPEYTDPNRC